MNERPPLYIYDRFGQEEPLKLLTNGSFVAISMTVGDYDGDGYDDLCVVNGGIGDMTVFWGGKNGLNIENKTVFGKALDMNDAGAASTTAGRMLLR